MAKIAWLNASMDEEFPTGGHSKKLLNVADLGIVSRTSQQSQIPSKTRFAHHELPPERKLR
jgi:hypothetical protein